MHFEILAAMAKFCKENQYEETLSEIYKEISWDGLKEMADFKEVFKKIDKKRFIPNAKEKEESRVSSNRGAPELLQIQE